MVFILLMSRGAAKTNTKYKFLVLALTFLPLMSYWTLQIHKAVAGQKGVFYSF